MRNLNAQTNTCLHLGHQGEQGAVSVSFDLTAFRLLHGSGTPRLVVKRPGEDVPYIAALSVRGDTAVWTVSAADSAIGGYGECELHWMVGQTLAKSEVFETFVAPALSAASEDVPSAAADWVNTVLAAANKAEAAAVHAPIIGENGNWTYWDKNAASYSIDSGIAAGEHAPLKAVSENGIAYSCTYRGALCTGTVLSIVFNRDTASKNATVSFSAGSQKYYLRLCDANGSGKVYKPGCENWFRAGKPYLFLVRDDGNENKYLVCTTPLLPASVQVNGIAPDSSGNIAIRTGDLELSLPWDAGMTLDDALEELNARVSSAQTAPKIKTVMDSVASVNTQYYLGRQQNVRFSLRQKPRAGDSFTCVFYSGQTPATLSITGTMLGSVCVPKANERVSLTAVFDGSYWVITTDTMSAEI